GFKHGPCVAGGTANLETAAAKALNSLGNFRNQRRVLRQAIHLPRNKISEQTFDVWLAGDVPLLLFPYRPNSWIAEESANVILLQSAHVLTRFLFADRNSSIGKAQLETGDRSYAAVIDSGACPVEDGSPETPRVRFAN